MLTALGDELEMANRRVIQAHRVDRLRWAEAIVELGVTWEIRGDGGIDLKVVRRRTPRAVVEAVAAQQLAFHGREVTLGHGVVVASPTEPIEG
jgi:hypothetical protein